jgi:hypothetical protein
VPTRGGITQARQWLGYEPLKELFGEVAVPVADAYTEFAFVWPWRLMSINGTEWDISGHQGERRRVRVRGDCRRG